MDTSAQLISFFFENLIITFYIVGLIASYAYIFRNKHSSNSFSLYNHAMGIFLFIGLGFTGVYGFIMHFFFPELTSSTIGWSPSPFEKEVAFTNLGLGISGLLGLRSSLGYKRAITVYATCFFWAAAINHLYLALTTHNYTSGNAGTILIGDFLLPFILIIFLRKISKTEAHC